MIVLLLRRGGGAGEVCDWDLRRCVMLFGSRGSRSLVLHSSPVQEETKGKGRNLKAGFGSLPILGHQKDQCPRQAEGRRGIRVAGSLPNWESG